MTRIVDPEIVGIPPNLWPPALELPNGKWLSQTGVIINYMSPKLGLAGYAKDDPNLDEDEKSFLNAKSTQLFLTVLDMTVEVVFSSFRGLIFVSFIESFSQIHNIHHPISVNLYYEDQKAEALRAAEQFRASRLPKFLQYFQSVLETNPANKDGKGKPRSIPAQFSGYSLISLTTTKVPSSSRISPQLRTWHYHTISPVYSFRFQEG